jgi:hypothetical protein
VAVKVTLELMHVVAAVAIIGVLTTLGREWFCSDPTLSGEAKSVFERNLCRSQLVDDRLLEDRYSIKFRKEK